MLRWMREVCTTSLSDACNDRRYGFGGTVQGRFATAAGRQRASGRWPRACAPRLARTAIPARTGTAVRDASVSSRATADYHRRARALCDPCFLGDRRRLGRSAKSRRATRRSGCDAPRTDGPSGDRLERGALLVRGSSPLVSSCGAQVRVAKPERNPRLLRREVAVTPP